MFGVRLEPHQIDHVHHAYLEIGQVLGEERHRGQCLERRDVAATGHDHIGNRAASFEAKGQMPSPLVQWSSGLVHGQPIVLRLLSGDDDVDVVPAATGSGRPPTAGSWCPAGSTPDDRGLLVDHVVDEAGILVGEAVVVLSPDMTRKEVVQRGDGPPPRDLCADFQPLRVLVEHRVDDVDEGLVAVEQTRADR